MPAPARTSIEEIIKAGRDILETEGIDGLTMQSIAARVGVRAPRCTSGSGAATTCCAWSRTTRPPS